jgi:hypothetical protein
LVSVAPPMSSRQMKNAAVRLLSLLAMGLPALSAMSSCGVSVQPINVAPGCPDMPLRGPSEYPPASSSDVIDDFDDGDMLLAKVGGRNGTWVGFATPMTATFFGEASNKCVANGTYSGHLTANDLDNYGANWNGVFIDPFALAVPFDASSYSGFSFWVATGDNAVQPLELPIGMMTTDTATGGGVCTATAGGCGDYYATKQRIPLTHTWTRWQIKFSDLAQKGTGMPQVPLRTTQFVSLMIWPERTYDIWIDDVRFER